MDVVTYALSKKNTGGSSGATEEQATQIQTNTNNISELKEDISNLSATKVDKAKLNKNGLDYGVVGDGSTDDSTAINALLASGWTTVYLPKKTYKISSPIVLGARYTELICDGTIQYDGEDSAIQILNNNSSVNVYQVNATNGTAIKIDSTSHKVYGINVKCKFISAKIGLHLYANTKEINYGVYDMDTISATELPIKVESVGDNILIHEHKFNLVSLKGELSAPYGVYLYGANCCRFLSGGVENLSSDAAAFYLENAEYNTVDNFRVMENYGSKRLKLVGYCRCNNFKFSYCKFTEVDHSELDYSNARTAINRFYGELSPDGSYHIGDFAEITKHGIIYDIIKAKPISIVLMEGYYSDKDIKMISTGYIPSVFKCNKSALNGTTWTLNEIYNYGCLSGGHPITFIFGDSNGKMILRDNQGDTIIDNSNGEYLGKTITIQSFGVDDSGANVWDVRELNANYATVEQVNSLINGAIGGSY